MARLLDNYRASLKPLSVEEPIDVAWHRLLGYVVAKLAFPTPISADAITIAAIAIGLASGICLAVPFDHNMQIGAALCTLSAVFDCADGQLARMRRKSSAFGRMLDGFSDSIVMALIVGGAVVHLVQQHTATWLWPFIIATMPTCTFHFSYYDHYKNVYLRLTEPTFREGEDLAAALQRKQDQLAIERPNFAMRAVWWLYIYYVRTQAESVHKLDPYTSARLNMFPSYEARRAEIYKKHALGPMRVWRSLFGLGTHVFVFSICAAIDRLDVYVAFRFGLLNLVAYGWLMWWQRRASQNAFAEMELTFPDQRK